MDKRAYSKRELGRNRAKKFRLYARSKQSQKIRSTVVPIYPKLTCNEDKTINKRQLGQKRVNEDKMSAKSKRHAINNVSFVPILPKPTTYSNESKTVKTKQEIHTIHSPITWKRRWRNTDNEEGIKHWFKRYSPLLQYKNVINDTKLNQTKQDFPQIPTPNKVADCIRTWCDSQNLPQYQWSVCFACGQRRMNHEIKSNGCSHKALIYMCKKLQNTAEHHMTNRKQLIAYINFLNKQTHNTSQICNHCYDTLQLSNPREWMMCFGYFRQTSCVLPELSEFEKLLIAIYRPHMSVYQLKSYDNHSQKIIRGNCCTYEQDVKLITKTLPLSPENFHLFIRILFLGTGPFPRHYLQRLVQVRLHEVYMWLSFLKENNFLYKNIIIQPKSNYEKKLYVDKWNIPINVQESYEIIPDAAHIDDQTSVAKVGDEDIEPTFHRLTVAQPPHSPLTHKELFERIVDNMKDANDYTYVSHPRKFGDNNDEHYFEKAFPTIFPFGTGGRKSIGNIALRHWISEWILDDGQTPSAPVQQDSTFLSILFGLSQKEDLDRTMFVMRRSNRLDTYSSIFKNITLDDILDVQDLIKRNKVKELYKNHVYCSVMQSLRSVGHSVVGTTIGAFENKNIAVGLLQTSGLPHMFFTANFDDRRNPLVATFAGHHIEFTDEGLIKCLSKRDRESIAANDPVAVADFAMMQLYCMISILFGYDLEKKAILEGGGILSYVHDIIAVPHTQGRGGIHIHMLLKFWGHPSINKLQEDLHKGVFASQYLKFVDHAFQTGPPENNNIGPLDSHLHDFIKPRKPPETYAPLSSWDKYYIEFANDQNRCAHEHLIHRHCTTCFKKLSHKAYIDLKNNPKLQDKFCRMGAPWPLVDETKICPDDLVKTPGHITYQQKRTNAWTVETNYPISTVMNINSSGHMFNAGEGGIASALYACHYMTSHHSQDFQFWEGIEQAFQEEMTKDSAMSSQAVLLRMFYAYLRTQQVCLSMATWHMRRYPLVITSISYNILRFRELVDYASGKRHWESTNNSSLLTQYMLRTEVAPLTKHWPLILFLRHYYPDTGETRIKPSTPVLVPYYQVPNFDLNENSEFKNDVLCTFFVVCFTAFETTTELQRRMAKRDRITQHILNDKHFPDDQYWANDDISFLRQFVQNIIDFQFANECTKMCRHVIPHYEGEDRIIVQDSHDDEYDNPIPTLTEKESQLLEINDEDDLYLGELTNAIDLFAQASYENLLHVIQNRNEREKQLLKSCITFNRTPSHYAEEVQDYLSTIETQSLMNDLYEITPEDIKYSHDSETPIFYWISLSSTWCTKEYCNVLFTVALKTTLTKDQAMIFFLYGAQIIATMQNVQICPPDVILAGGAGTGKSHVLSALLVLLQDLAVPSQRIQRGAFTGSAASNIGGSTLHHLYRWQGKTTRPRTSEPQSLLIKKFWELVWLQFIDEFGTLDARLFNGITDTLSFYRKNIQDQLPDNCHNIFGGLSTILAGDPNQLSPICSHAVYVTPKNIQNTNDLTLTDKQHTKAFHSWRSIKWCIYLTEPKHFKNGYSQFITNFEKGIILPEHLKKLNARRMSVLDQKELLLFHDATAIVQRNILRTRFSMKHVTETYESSDIYWHVAHDTNNKGIDPHELRQLYKHRTDMDTNGLLHILPLVDGEEYLLSKNILPEQGLAKGSRVRLVKVHNRGMRNEFIECKYTAHNNNENVWPGVNKSNHITLFPNTQTIYLAYKTPNTKSIMVPVSRTQYQLIPAHAVTIYKAQGQTLRHVIAVLQVCRNRQQVYVILSRATDFDDLLLLDRNPLTTKELLLKQNSHVRDEKNRLEELDSKTRNEIWQTFPQELHIAYDRFCSYKQK